MKSRIFGVLTFGTFFATSIVYLSFSEPHSQAENSTSGPAHRASFESDPTLQTGWRWWKKETTATSLSAVGWEGCEWCEKLKKEVLPVLQKQGYDVRYVYKKDWKGPKIKVGPTLFYFDGKKIVKVEKGYQSVEHIKKTLKKADKK